MDCLVKIINVTLWVVGGMGWLGLKEHMHNCSNFIVSPLVCK
jgi:hypothetical protein